LRAGAAAFIEVATDIFTSPIFGFNF